LSILVNGPIREQVVQVQEVVDAGHQDERAADRATCEITFLQYKLNLALMSSFQSVDGLVLVEVEAAHGSREAQTMSHESK
jgi:hypothetical protein